MRHLLARMPPVATFGPLLALLAACVFFASQTDRFLTGQNVSLILQQVMVVSVMAIGQTMIILTAGIDLSCGMVMALGSIVMTKFAVDLGMNPNLAIAAGLLACSAFGLLNGALITYVRLPPFIVTLGTLNIAFAIYSLTIKILQRASADLNGPPHGQRCIKGATSFVCGQTDFSRHLDEEQVGLIPD